MSSLLLAGLIELGLITYRDIHGSAKETHTVAGLPLPADYVAVAVLYGGLSFASGGAQTPAALLAWGITLATFLAMWDPSNPAHLSMPQAGFLTGSGTTSMKAKGTKK